MSLREGEIRIPSGCAIAGVFSRRERLPRQARACKANAEDLAKIEPYLQRYVTLFNREIPDDGTPFWLLTPNSSDPYRQLYVDH